ncbi:hypothetical protein NTGHW29_740004 [Candidatus Nitrotoga sp. HW29]|nr:hypothetical protein NTGHW29_740004 [Candidatus Nitrotoga sp. HW29]
MLLYVTSPIVDRSRTRLQTKSKYLTEQVHIIKIFGDKRNIAYEQQVYPLSKWLQVKRHAKNVVKFMTP